MKAQTGKGRFNLCSLIVVLGASCAGAKWPPPRAALHAQVACGHECLRNYADRYLDALARRDIRGLPVAASARITENGERVQIGEGFWRKADGAGSYRAYVSDPDSGQVGVQASMKEAGADVLVMLRLKVVAGKFSEIETFVVGRDDTGDWEPARLPFLRPIYDSVVSSPRSSRADLLRITDAYFTALQTQGTAGYRPAPFAKDANRFENGLRATNDSAAANRLFWMSAAEQFDRGMFRGRRVEDRRYPVVDVERGTVLAIVTFRMDAASSRVLFLSELFKITDGQIREIRAVQLDRRHDAVIGWP